MCGKRILCVIDNLGSGGAQRQMVNLAIGLRKLGHETSVFTYSNAPGHFQRELDATGIELANFPRGAGHPANTIWRLRRFVEARGFEAVIAFMPMPSFIACVALLGNRSVRLVVSERSSFPSGVPTIGDRLVRAFHRRATWITTNSHHQARLMREAFPRMQERLKTIYNGYDVSRFRLRQSTDGTRSLRMVAVGRITSGKNIENFVEAVRMTRSSGIDLRIDWIGRLDNVRWASGYYETLSARIDGSGIGGAWRWLGEKSDVPSLLVDYDALVHPSLYEGLPNAVCEAFACGLPVIASNVCDHPMLIDAPRRGFLFDPADPGSIADAVRAFAAQDNSERRRMGLAARQYATEELSLERMASSYGALI